MSSGQLTSLVRHLRRLSAPAHGQRLSDRQLLERFANQRDQAAFGELVERHGGLVLGVCRRVLRQPQDAEDAFQATFLVLARKASAVRWRESVAGWLYQVAYRVAAEVRGKAARRRFCERQAAALTGTRSEEPTWREGCALLDEELQQLPDKYRRPLLLCYLEGEPRDRAAERLGWSLRTLERRLQQGRELLRTRLARRGVALSAALLAASLTQEATASAAAALAESLSGAALEFAGFARGVTDTPLSPAFDLAERTVRAMFLQTLKTAAAGLLTLALLALGAGLLAHGAAPLAPAAAAPQEKPKAEGPPSGPKTARRDAARTQEAIAAGLGWLVRHQAPDGRWALPTAQNDVAGTAFGLLPLLAAGETHRVTGPLHPHARNADRGLLFLIKAQQPDGNFGGGMYAQALATWALCEAYGLTKDPQLKGPAQRALDYSVNAQHAGGGWRYAPRTPGDTSVTSWHLLALKSGEAAGLRVPPETFRKASLYLDSAAAEDGSYCYVPGAGHGSASMTAAALNCRLLLGWQPGQPGVVKGVALLHKTPPGTGKGNIYSYHYATRVLAAVGGKDWDLWETAMRKYLLDQHEGAGAAAENRGSWQTANDIYGQSGGRLMITSLSLLTLQTCAQHDRLASPARALGAQEAAALWAELGSVNFLKAREDIRALAASPHSVPLVRKALRPAPAVDGARIATLVKDLDSPQYTVREKAVAELKAYKELAWLALQQSLQTQPSLEARLRAERLLQEIDGRAPSAEQSQALRGVEVLRQAGTPQARELLADLAQGAPEAPLTQHARAALESLAPAKERGSAER